MQMDTEKDWLIVVLPLVLSMLWHVCMQKSLSPTPQTLSNKPEDLVDINNKEIDELVGWLAQDGKYVVGDMGIGWDKWWGGMNLGFPRMSIPEWSPPPATGPSRPRKCTWLVRNSSPSIVVGKGKGRAVASDCKSKDEEEDDSSGEDEVVVPQQHLPP